MFSHCGQMLGAFSCQLELWKSLLSHTALAQVGIQMAGLVSISLFLCAIGSFASKKGDGKKKMRSVKGKCICQISGDEQTVVRSAEYNNDDRRYPDMMIPIVCFQCADSIL